MPELCCHPPDPLAARAGRARPGAASTCWHTQGWDSGQRHAARPWYHLCLLGVVLLIDLLVIAIAPFILANTDEPVATWIALGLLAALTLKLAGEGFMRQAVRLERVALEPSGLRLLGARLTLAGTAYRPLDQLIDWGDVEAMDVVDAGSGNHVNTVVDIRLAVANPFGAGLRLVQLNRARAQAFADKALELQSAARPYAAHGGGRPEQR